MKVRAKENYHYTTVLGEEVEFYQGKIYEASVIQYTQDPYEIIHDTGISVRCDNDTFNRYFSLVVE